ncbi:MAG: hypothetical protein CMI53_01815 [Parcubacteria group bacterium]|nr:hypothetical protein [Parcubacteria group bacterium]|tara:strand:+ start:2432 stop:2824 length:393 start_codon:yes stop_codon:yes gene_type:complete
MTKPFTKTAILLVFSFFLIGGCTDVIDSVTGSVDYLTGKVEVAQKKNADRALAIIKCKNLCQTKIATNSIIEDESPCLSNEIMPDWVCDIAHNPRTEVDDDPKNQCSAFRDGTAHHFVELDGNCSTIEVY